MSAVGIVRAIAILSSGLLSGILFGDRMGATFARPCLNASSFLEFQRIQHVHFVRMMPPLTLTAIVAGFGWLIMVRTQWVSSQFWLLAVAMGAMVFAAALTLAVNIPINKQLLAWNATAPPANMREIWRRWERAHTIRTVLWFGAFVLEVVALCLFAAPSASASVHY